MPCQPSRTLCGSKHPQCPFWVPAPAFHMPEMLGVNYCLVSHRVWWHCGTDGHACAGISDRHMLTLSQLFLCVRVVIPISPHHYSQIAQVGYQCCFWQHFVSLFHPVLISLQITITCISSSRIADDMLSGKEARDISSFVVALAHSQPLNCSCIPRMLLEGHVKLVAAKMTPPRGPKLGSARFAILIGRTVSFW